MYYGSDETDEAGKYELIVDKYVNGKEVKATGCWVRLVSSSDPTCNIPTDFAGGRSGVKLQRPTWIYRDIKPNTLWIHSTIQLPCAMNPMKRKSITNSFNFCI